MRRLPILAMLILSACGGGTLYPITSGSHRAGPIPDGRFVVWSNHPVAEQAVTSLLLEVGQTVVERSKLEQVFDEQRLRLHHSPDNEANVIRVGQLAGATQVVLVEVRGTEPPRVSYMFTISTPPSVTVRSVDVQTGAVLWSGSALYTDVPANMDSAVGKLAIWAIGRATCRTEAGYVWREWAAGTKGGCLREGVESRH